MPSDPHTAPELLLISCRGVERVFGAGDARTVALAGVDFDVKRGEIVAVAGPSGSGKSTLLHVIGAMDRPGRGSVTVIGRDLAKLSDGEAARFRREEIGFVFQFFNLIPTLSALDNVALPAQLAGKSAAAARAKARGLLERVGLGARGADYPDALSGGEQQRVAVARALVNDPKLVLADEPTGALDQRTGEDVLTLLSRLVRDLGMTLVMATHSESALATATRVVRLMDGRIVNDSRPTA